MSNTLDETLTLDEVAALLGVSMVGLNEMLTLGTFPTTNRTLVGDGSSVWEADDEVITEATHGLVVGDQVYIDVQSGATGATSGYYYVKTAPDANTFTVAATDGGDTTAISADGVAHVYKVNPTWDGPRTRVLGDDLETYISALVSAAGIS